MSDVTLFSVSVTFSMITGTAAGLLALLTWKIFRAAPFGRALFTLTIVMAAFTLYHGVLLVFDGESMLAASLVRSAVYTGMAVVVGLVIASQRRLRSGVTH